MAASEPGDNVAEVDRVLQKFVAWGLLPLEPSWHGCDDAEIGQLTDAVGFALPRPYEHFLRRVGKVRGARLFQGSDVFWPWPFRLLEDDGLTELFQDNDLAPLPKPALPLCSHQGYIFYWMHEDQPAVWRFSEGTDHAPLESHSSFATWLFELGFEWAMIDPRTVK